MPKVGSTFFRDDHQDFIYLNTRLMNEKCFTRGKELPSEFLSILRSVLYSSSWSNCLRREVLVGGKFGSTTRDSDRDLLPEPCSIAEARFCLATESTKCWEQSLSWEANLADDECFSSSTDAEHLLGADCLPTADSFFSIINTSTCLSQEKKNITFK